MPTATSATARFTFMCAPNTARYRPTFGFTVDRD
jgi:hypothetical protein